MRGAAETRYKWRSVKIARVEQKTSMKTPGHEERGFTKWTKRHTED